MGLLEGGSGKNGILTVVLASLFLISLGIIHNAFADNVTATVSVGSSPSSIGVNPNTNRIYLSDGNGIEIIDGTTNTVALMSATTGNIGVNPVTNKIYVTNYNNGTVSVFDGATNSFTGAITVPSSPLNIAVDPSTNKIYVTGAHTAGSTPVYVIDGTTNQVVQSLLVDGDAGGDIASNPSTNYIYLTTTCRCLTPHAFLYVINGTNDTVVQQMTLGIEGGAVGVNSATNMIYVNNDNIYVINGTTNTVASQIGGFHAGDGLGVNPATNKIYVADQNNNTVSVINGSTNTVVQTLSVGSDPFKIAANQNTNKIYVENRQSNSVSVIDGSSSGTSSATTAPSAPQNLQTFAGNSQVFLSWATPSNNGGSPVTGYMIQRSTDGGTTWSTIISNTGNTKNGYLDKGLAASTTYTYQVSAINSVGTSPPSNTVSATTSTVATIQVGSLPFGIAYDSAKGEIFVTNPGSDSVSVISDDTNTVVATIQVGSFPFGAAYDSAKGEIFVANYNSNSVSVISDATNTVVDTISGFSSPFAIAYDSAKGEIFVTNPGSDSVSVISDDTNTVVATIPENSSHSQGVAYDSAKGEIFVVNKGSKYGCTDGCPGSVSVISDATNTVVDTISGFSSPDGAAYDSAKGEIFVTDSGSSSVSVISDDTNTVVATIPVRISPIAIAYDSAKGEIFVANYNSNSVSVISDATNTVVDTISGFSSPDGAAYDSAKGEIFVASGNSNYVYVISDAANTTPGSITLESVQSTSDTTDSSNQITLSNFDATAGNDKLLVVGVSANNNNVGSITFAGVQLTRAVSHFTNNDAEFWYLTNPTGSGDITVTMNGPTQAVVGAYSFSGVNQTVPIPAHITRHNLTPSSPAISITTSHVNDLVLDLPSIWGGVTLGSPTCTQQWNVNVPSQITGASSSTIVPSPATVTCSWTASSANTWDDVAIELKAASTTTSPTVPDAPTGLVATGGNVQVTLSWAAPSNDGGSAVTGYNVYRGTTAGGEDPTPVASRMTSTTYTDTGLINDQAYYYIVRAVNSVGTSGPSNEASATPASSSSGTTSSITLNNVQSTSGTTSSSNQITLSSFNVGTASNQLLLVGVSANNNNVASVTFNGTPLTRAVSSFFNNDAELWYMTNPSGTGDIAVTMNGATQAVVGAYSFSGVNQSSPIPTHRTNHNTSAGSPSISVTTQYPNDWVLDLPSIYGGSTLGSPTCTQQWDVNMPNQIAGASSSTTVSSPTTITCKWTASSADFWDDIAVELRAGQ